MKTGRSLQEIAVEIQRQQASKRDYIAPTERLRVQLAEPTTQPILMVADGNGGTPFSLNQLAHEQLAAKVGIPKAYYDRMREHAPALLAGNVNHWFEQETGRYMLRTLDGQVRAVLSDRYRPLDNADLAEAALPALQAAGVQVLSCEITERRFYIKAVDQRITKNIPTGRKMGDGSHVFFDTLSPAIVISNSEVGCGALSIETGVWTKVCTNLAIAAQRSMRKYHIGGRMGGDMGEGLYELLSDKTKQLTDAAIWAQTRDLVAAAFDRAKFDALTNSVGELVEQPLTGDPAKVVEVTGKRFGLLEGERTSVLRHLIEGGDLTAYGLFNAVTRTAEDADDYDRATQLERFGGELIELPRMGWQELVAA